MQAARFVVALLLGTGAPSNVVAGYGFDAVPESNFHHGAGQFYGADQVPRVTNHTVVVFTAYGVDRVPGRMSGEVEEHPHHVLIRETIQHLTAAVEITPGSRATTRTTPSVDDSRLRPSRSTRKCSPAR